MQYTTDRWQCSELFVRAAIADADNMLLICASVFRNGLIDIVTAHISMFVTGLNYSIIKAYCNKTDSFLFTQLDQHPVL